jgi:[acyl-carrier-protein] S-malonyltransferase
MRAALFPGQGSQAVGIGHELYQVSPAARQALDQAEATLPGLLKILWEGPEEQLRLTEHQQPGLLAVGYAAFQAYLEAGGLPPQFAAGHSLGEWTAWVAAGSLAFEEALILVRKRGEYMQAAVPPGIGGMAAILKLTRPQVEELIKGLELELANLNSPQQTVVSGPLTALQALAPRVRELGGRLVTLPVSAPFHSSLMAPARERLAQDLARVAIAPPRFPIYSNVTAQPEEDPERIRQLLLEQITKPVRWVEILEDLWRRGVREFLEFGSGNVLSSLVERTLPEARAASLNTPHDLQAWTGAS